MYSKWTIAIIAPGVFQDVIESQERTITDLLRAVREQNEQLNNQKNKIKSLEDKVGYM